MDTELREWIERRFAVREPRASKVVSLARAVEDNVRASDTVHLGITHARGSAAFWELLRQFIGRAPGFTLCGVAMSSPFSPLVHAGLARKVVTSWAGDSYWTPGPNGAYQRAWAGDVEFEHWSILTFVQRLQAAARGVPFTSTASLVGSSMMSNPGVRALEKTSALIPALTPDISIFHAPAADEYGNVLFSPPYMEDVWGAFAARRGVIVTVDRILDPATLRDNAHMVRVPGSAVRAVVEAPFGAHPGGLLPSGVPGVQGYGEDYEFWIDIRRAAKDPAAMDEWIKYWVLDAADHDGYLKRLGDDRIDALKRRVDPAAFEEELAASLDGVDLDAAPNAVEWAIVAAGRALKERMRDNGYTTVLAGAGMANLAAWLAAYDLADEGITIDLVAEMGLVGYWPRPGEPILFNQRNFPTCTMLTGIDTALGVIVGGAGARAVGALGAAQVDREGNINSTMLEDQLLMGSGGANDVITCARETVLIVQQSPQRMVEELPYRTGSGTRVSTLVTTLGVYRRDGNELILTDVFGDDVDTAVAECVARCAWPLRVARAVGRVDAPTAEELRTLRVMDPHGYFRS